MAKKTFKDDSKERALLQERHRQERRRQVRGSLLLAAAVLIFGLWRAGIHRVLPQGWWRLW